MEASNVTVAVIHLVFLEAQAARQVEGLLRVRTALADVAYATQRVVDGQPEIVFYGARQSLRAALAGVSEAKLALPISYRVGIDTVHHARQNELQADHEVDQALAGAREKLTVANRQSNEAMHPKS